MPCYTQREVTVELNVADVNLLTAGLKAAGFTVQTTPRGFYVTNSKGQQAHIRDGKITTQQTSNDIINEVKRAYSGEVVRTAAKRFGWTLSKTNEQNTVVAGRRF